MGSDLTVVNAARVSFHRMSDTLSEKNIKLIKYLATHEHWTPFAHPQVTFHIKAPMPIRTQFFKHKVGFVENEISRRYVDEEPEFFHPDWSARPSGSIKQGAGDRLDDDSRNKAQYAYYHALDTCKFAYQQLLNYGVAPEQARFILPQATYTEWYWTGSLAAVARFYNQRSSPHAQEEIRVYAVSWQALTGQES
jgi:thymidylate synthase (FAD)